MQRLYFISQETSEESHTKSILNACKAGIKLVQLRIKDKSRREIEDIAKVARKICDLYQSRLIINDHADVAKLVQADGLHIGKKDNSIRLARKIIGKKKLIGATANTFKDILRHYSEGADYIGLGPYAFTKTKKDLSFILGLEGYKHILEKCREKNIHIPIFAIGGIKPEDIFKLLKLGIYGIAISSSIVFAKDKEEKIFSIQKMFQNFRTIKSDYYASNSR